MCHRSSPFACVTAAFGATRARVRLPCAAASRPQAQGQWTVRRREASGDGPAAREARPAQLRHCRPTSRGPTRAIRSRQRRGLPARPRPVPRLRHGPCRAARQLPTCQVRLNRRPGGATSTDPLPQGRLPQPRRGLRRHQPTLWADQRPLAPGRALREFGQSAGRPHCREQRTRQLPDRRLGVRPQCSGLPLCRRQRRAAQRPLSPDALAPQLAVRVPRQ